MGIERTVSSGPWPHGLLSLSHESHPHSHWPVGRSENRAEPRSLPAVIIMISLIPLPSHLLTTSLGYASIDVSAAPTEALPRSVSPARACFPGRHMLYLGIAEMLPPNKHGRKHPRPAGQPPRIVPRYATLCLASRYRNRDHGSLGAKPTGRGPAGQGQRRHGICE